MNPIRLTPTVKWLVITCFAAFVIQKGGDLFLGTHLKEVFALTPDLAIKNFEIWQLFTYSFLHDDPMHLFLNLMMLAFIGSELEAIWGRTRFLRFYFFCTGIAALTYLIAQIAFYRGSVPMVGASGAIYGLLMAYGLLFGERVLLFMMIFPMKAKHFVWVLALVEFISSIFSSGNAMGSVAHLGGMAAGFGLLWGRAAWKVFKRQHDESASRRQREARVKGASHLKLVANNPKAGSKSKSGAGSSGDDHDSDGSPKTWH